MANSKTIYIVHAADADQHLGKLKSLLEDFIREKRIKAYSSIHSDTVEANSFNAAGVDDMVIVLLTSGIAVVQKQIEEILLKLKDGQVGTKIAEIIVDNMPYDLQFMAYPDDLQPIRDSENMDAIWQKIGVSLREQLPISTEKDWKKWAKYTLAIVILGGFIYLIPKITGKNPKADFSYKVLDPIKGVASRDTTCYLPCQVLLANSSANAKNIQWKLEEMVIDDENDPDYVFLKNGAHRMTLVAKNGQRIDSISKDVKVKAPPLANFEMEGSGCTAPCGITFKNTSENASTYEWTFLEGTTAGSSTLENPAVVNYPSDGDFKVQLKATNEDGITSDTIQKVTILKDFAPYAHFTVSKQTPGYPKQQTFLFKNNSKNGLEYEWDFRDGTPVKVTTTPSNVTHTFDNYGTYVVKITVTGQDGIPRSFPSPVNVRDGKWVLTNSGL